MIISASQTFFPVATQIDTSLLFKLGAYITRVYQEAHTPL